MPTHCGGGATIGIVNIKGVSERTLRDCARLYCKIWREEPWTEDFWTPEAVMQDMRMELARSCAEGYLAVNEDDSTVLGFTWGYAVSQPEMQIISGNGKLDFLFSSDDRVFYVDELGVAQWYRRLRLGNSLTANLLVAARAYDINLVTLRTDKRAEAARSLYQKIGFKDLLVEDPQYPDRTYWALSI